MGAKESKAFPISAEEANKRLSDGERRRLQDAFRRLPLQSGAASKAVFLRQVLGEGVPHALGERIFNACVGGVNGGSSRGIHSRELNMLLVLLTKGTDEEKIKFLFGILSSSDNSPFVERADLIRFLKEWDDYFQESQIAPLFREEQRVSYEQFYKWVDANRSALALTEWLLKPDSNLSLTNRLDTPTFYQTLSGVTHLEESEIVELEKRFWNLTGSSSSGQITKDTIESLVSPPLPEVLVPSFFSALDENQDGHIDFKELSCGVSAACRGPELERQKFCFKIFDADRDGVLNETEMKIMMQCLIDIHNQVLSEEEKIKEVPVRLVRHLLDKHDTKKTGTLSQEDFLVWTVDDPLPGEFSKLLFQLCHVVLGLRPLSRADEGSIVRGWLEREEKLPMVVGAIWHLISMEWWTNWHSYVNNQHQESLHGSSAKKTSDLVSTMKRAGNKKTPSLEATIAMDSNTSVVGTSYHQLGDNAKRSVTPSAESSRNSSRIATPNESPHVSRKNSSSTSSTSNGLLAPVARPGLIDNSVLIQTVPYKVPSLTAEGGKLKSNLKISRGKDYELIPERLWKALVVWYGGSPSLPRQVVRTKSGKIELELYPFSVKVYKHQHVARNSSSQAGSSSTAASGAMSSVMGSYGIAAGAAGSAATNSPYNQNHSSAPASTKRYHAYQCAFSRRTSVTQINDFLTHRLHLKSEDLRLWHFKDENNLSLLEDDSRTLEDLGFKDESSLLVEIRSRDGTWPEEITSIVAMDASNSRRSSALNHSVCTPGVTGLNNLGNTCYMNAAIQCVSNTKILASYFNRNCHLHELNRTNPLGMKGHIAKRYGDLVRDMWSPDTKTIAPIKLRWTIGRYRPHFAGFQQQDAQELLGFLLDGLHEDLNRVTDKPYVELKDSDGRPDVVVAAEAWENHILRNKSIVVDLFHGQLKSKVTCKVCSHESVRFDPFTVLSLPLPMESSIHLEVIVIRQDGSLPIKYGLTLDMESRFSSIKPFLSRLCDIPPQNLILVDIVHSHFRIFSAEEQKLKSMSGSCIYAYEFEASLTHWRSKSTSPTNLSFSDIQRNSRSASSTKSAQAANASIKSAAASASSNGKKGASDSTKVSNGDGGHRHGSSHPEDKGSRWSKGICMGACFKKKDSADSEGPSSSLQMTKPGSSRASPSPSSSKSDKEALLGGAENSSTPLKTLSSPHLSVPSGHSRQGSATSSLHSVDLSTATSFSGEDIADCQQGVIAALHRKMMPQEVYFLAAEKYRPSLFGIPLILACNETTSYKDLYKSVWSQVSRLVSPLPPRDSAQNHATDCDDSLRYEYPFELKLVSRDGHWCSRCPWHRFCRGCAVPCNMELFNFASSYLAIDWDQTALHLRYLSGQERAFKEDPSVAESLRAASEPITLEKCLESFTREEMLGEDEKYYCPSCKTHQLAMKKLQIWRLPPVLIVHLKRFHFLNGRWIKSHKIVDFPSHGLCLTEYLASVPSTTLKRYQALCQRRLSAVNGIIPEQNEPDSLNSDEIDIVDAITQGDLLDDSDDDDVAVGTAQPGGSVNPPRQKKPVYSPNTKKRQRQQSTSLLSHPIKDDNLQDFHQHKLVDGADPLQIKYNLYSMVCHSGVLGGGHYVSFSKTESGKWYCQNDSSCKEVPSDQTDKATAYILFYEREGLSSESYLPKVHGATPDTKDLDDELETDFKKQCSIM